MPGRRAPSARGVFIAGTDTGVGKTLVACAVLRGLSAIGLRVAGMKPVAAGARRIRGAWYNEDVAQLRAAGNVDSPLQWVNPFCFAPAIAPHIAANEVGQVISIARIAAKYACLARRADVVVVEGAGGLLVPLGSRHVVADIPLRLGLPVVLVVGMRLGCLNHALLSAEALRSRGLIFAGWVANEIDAGMSRRDQNLDGLRKRLGAPLLGRIRHARKPRPESVAQALDISRLNTLI
ncbi:MAG: dethiobiotin synthase [Burkholderiales bacterium]